MRVPAPCSHFEADLAVHLPELRDAQRCGLALWVLGAVLAHSACQSAVLAALEPLGYARHATRQGRPREGRFCLAVLPYGMACTAPGSIRSR